VEIFEELLNAERVTPDALDQVVDGQLNAAGEQEPVPEVSREEVKKAFTFMLNACASGKGGLPAKLFKYVEQELTNSMYTLIRSV
jgi:hypothetical protein